MYIKLGDIVKVLGMNDDDKLEDWYGEIVGRLDNQQYEIYYIEPCDGIWKFNETVDVVDKASINEVSRTKHGDYAAAWSKFGFKLLNQFELLYTHETTVTDSDASESLDSCDSWSTSESDATVSDFIDDSANELSPNHHAPLPLG
jgi:hypothetical protein